MITYLATPDNSFRIPLAENLVSSCAYVKGLIDQVDPESPESTIQVQHSDQTLLEFTVAFLEQHANDPQPEEGEEAKKKQYTLTDWDKQHFGKYWTAEKVEPETNIKIVDLLKMADFLQCKVLLDAAATVMGQILVTKNEQEVQQWFGRHRTFTKEEEEAVAAKYPVPFN